MQASKKTVTIPAADLVDLKDYEGRTFVIRKNDQETLVTLVKVKRRDVYLSYTKSDRQDQFTVPQAKFRKYYGLLATAKVEVGE